MPAEGGKKKSDAYNTAVVAMMGHVYYRYLPTYRPIEVESEAGFARPGDVTVSFFGLDGASQGSRTVTVPPWGVVSLPGSPAGASTDLGRVDVVPAGGTSPFLIVLLRQDRQTRDTDVVLPLVVAK